MDEMNNDWISRSAVIELIENCHVLEDAYCLIDYINELPAQKEGLKEQGELLELSCKAGDTVFCIKKDFKESIVYQIPDDPKMNETISTVECRNLRKTMDVLTAMPLLTKREYVRLMVIIDGILKRMENYGDN